ncbi:morphogenetic protein [Yersinia enterocolitica]|uniref:morphogenetic protein n=1 Tax=Yersinia enterocolitica TaxID=630 RepID=UPI0021E7A936|nr:morphogenetic protein [Yersinia enterocolitica]ELY5242796.1 morphogenetic protein [Yersinia enterocolitica]UYJ99063.1 morphogenetic protein [Yersinia enterocolitica]HDL7347382.1 morphogenetic protein [Yersinia enterocolitica]
MNEKPILFNSEMVNAILSGRKTMTRRIISEKTLHLFGVAAGAGECHPLELCDERSQSYYLEFCPLGKPGDQLWVRECFSDLEDFDFFNPSVPDVIPGYWYWADGNPEWGNWTKPKPSIHMPRWASRINLLITGVRVERLNDISEQDARAEGVKAWRGPAEELVGGKLAFLELWDSIYGQKEGENWQANPWVWVINFERMEAK